MTTSLSYSSPKPTGGVELWAWLFMRLSGLALLGLALGHLVIMHLLNNVDAIDYAFVAGRYAGWLWRGYDLAMLLLAMLHGLNGARTLLDDYAPARWRRGAVTALYLVGAVFLVMGTVAIVCFTPATTPP